METLGSFIIKKREEKKITPGMLAYKTGIHRSTIHKIENNDIERINPKNLKAIAEALNINYLNLFILAGYVDIEAIMDFSEDIIQKSVKEKIDEHLKAISKVNSHSIPLLKYEAITSEKIDHRNPISFLNVDSEEKDCISILMNSNDMSPTILDESIIIVKTDVEINSGDIGIFSIDENVLIRRFFRKNETTLLLSDKIPYNPIIIEKNDNFKIIGKVLKTINKLK